MCFFFTFYYSVPNFRTLGSIIKNFFQKRIGPLKVVSHCHSFQHSEWQIEGQTGGQSEAHIDILPCNSFQHSARHTLFISRCSDTTSPAYNGEVVRRSQDVTGWEERFIARHHVWMSTEWQRVFLHFLQSALLVPGLHSIAAGTWPLCPWMWASTMSDSVTPALIDVTGWEERGAQHLPLSRLDVNHRVSIVY